MPRIKELIRIKETLYEQVMNGVLKKIQSGFWKENDMISTESELEKEYAVSNITVRRALNELERANVIYRMKGKGSFVCEKQADRPVAQNVALPQIITVVMPFHQDNYTAGPILQGLTEVFEDLRYVLNVVDSQFSIEKEMALLKSNAQISSGIVCYPISSHGNVEVLCELKAKGYPVVLIDKKINNIPFCSVVSDNQKSAYQATSYLIEQGHTQIGFLHDSTMELSSVTDRCLGYMRALTDHGIAPSSDNVISNFMTFSEKIDPDAYADIQLNQHFTSVQIKRKFYIGLLHWIRQHQITALFCTNIDVATNLIRYSAEAGVSIPQDLSLLGFDDDAIAQNLNIPLTTIKQDLHQIGYCAGMILKNCLECNEPLPDQEFQIPAELIIRESVAPYRNTDLTDHNTEGEQ